MHVSLRQAVQTKNVHQFATTSVTIQVLVKSLHRPEFEKTQYEAVVQGIGTMAMDATDKDKILKILATDQDYAGVAVKTNTGLSLDCTGKRGIIDIFIFTYNTFSLYWEILSNSKKYKVKIGND